jgi:hypothetical protein
VERGPSSGGGVVPDFSFVFVFIIKLMCLSYVLFWQNCSALPELVFGVVLGVNVLRIAEPFGLVVLFFIKSHNNQLG